MLYRLSRCACAAALLVLTGLTASACGGGSDADPDGRGPDPAAPDARPLCYNGGGTLTPGAEVDLRTFRDGIGLIRLNDDEELSVYAGPQGGHHFYMHARIRGLSPGDPDQPTETNPATWFSATLVEDGTDLTQAPCVFPLAYEVDGDGELALPYAPILQLNSVYVPAIYGKRVRIKVEVMDGEGRYATREVEVVAVPADLEDGPDDAGVPGPAPDAGVPDAAAPVTPDASGVPGD
jgi:hypothetical protein